MNRQRWVDYWQNIIRARLAFFPTFCYCQQFISGQINLGGLMKIAQAFMLVSNNFKLVYL